MPSEPKRTFGTNCSATVVVRIPNIHKLVPLTATCKIQYMTPGTDISFPIHFLHLNIPKYLYYTKKNNYSKIWFGRIYFNFQFQNYRKQKCS